MSKPRSSLNAKKVRQELRPEQSTELLKELHILTRQGNLNADSLRKLKQVNHFLQFLEDPVTDVFERNENPLFVDVGAGKSYLGFLFYEAYLKERSTGRVLAIEKRSDLTLKCHEISKKLDFSRFDVIEGDVQTAQWPERVHLTMALHACDTATDDAIVRAVKSRSDYIVLVPCCQAELARQLGDTESEVAGALWDYPLHKREFGSHLTNVIRTLALKSLGYQVTVTELVGWEHSFKNELILAKKVKAFDNSAREKLAGLLKSIPVRPQLLGDLSEAGHSLSVH
ncbi:MAG: SAM-dependent methyltransferase [Oligoflexia bacterium]|nr:SAM-dependent methyltransferase [Oligoflexia bacterium]